MYDSYHESDYGSHSEGSSTGNYAAGTGSKWSSIGNWKNDHMRWSDRRDSGMRTENMTGGVYSWSEAGFGGNSGATESTADSFYKSFWGDASGTHLTYDVHDYASTSYATDHDDNQRTWSGNWTRWSGNDGSLGYAGANGGSYAWDWSSQGGSGFDWHETSVSYGTGSSSSSVSSGSGLVQTNSTYTGSSSSTSWNDSGSGTDTWSRSYSYDSTTGAPPPPGNPTGSTSSASSSSTSSIFDGPGSSTPWSRPYSWALSDLLGFDPQTGNSTTEGSTETMESSGTHSEAAGVPAQQPYDALTAAAQRDGPASGTAGGISIELCGATDGDPVNQLLDKLESRGTLRAGSLLELSRRHLTEQEKQYLRRYIPAEDLENAVIHLGKMPWFASDWAAGITLGNHIYIRDPNTDFSTAKGMALLAHELAHVGQFRNGMNRASYLWSCRHGYRNSSYEKAARDIATPVLTELRNRHGGRLP